MLDAYPQCFFLESIHNGKLLESCPNNIPQRNIWSLFRVLYPWVIYPKRKKRKGMCHCCFTKKHAAKMKSPTHLHEVKYMICIIQQLIRPIISQPSSHYKYYISQANMPIIPISQYFHNRWVTPIYDIKKIYHKTEWLKGTVLYSLVSS